MSSRTALFGPPGASWQSSSAGGGGEIGAPADAARASSVDRTRLDVSAIYDQHAGFVWRTLRALGVDESRIEDAVQDVFVVVHRRAAEFAGRSTVETWLFAIARRVAHDHRRHVRRKGGGEELPCDLVDPAVLTPHEAVEHAEAARLLTQLLDQLDDDRREVFVLVELEQLPVPAVAEALGVNPNTVYSRLRAARKQFERAIARRIAKDRGGRR
jgi:RNA polymerase sigma-70 factor (ECF subfamily)